jgi:hypothetical protein
MVKEEKEKRVQQNQLDKKVRSYAKCARRQRRWREKHPRLEGEKKRLYKMGPSNTYSQTI